MPMCCPCQIREPGGVSCRLGEYARPEESGIAPSSSLGPSREPERAEEYPSASRDSEHNGRQAPDLCGEGYRAVPAISAGGSRSPISSNRPGRSWL